MATQEDVERAIDVAYSQHLTEVADRVITMIEVGPRLSAECCEKLERLGNLIHRRSLQSDWVGSGINSVIISTELD